MSLQIWLNNKYVDPTQDHLRIATNAKIMDAYDLFHLPGRTHFLVHYYNTLRDLLLAGFCLLVLLTPSVDAQDALQTARNRLAGILASQESEAVTNDPVAPQSVPEQPTPSITFEQIQSSDSRLHTTVVNETENWLVSESWCTLCPAAKRRFLSEGNPSSRIINVAQARAMGEQWSGSVPHRFSRQTSRTYTQPLAYRKQWPGKWTLNGTSRPAKSSMLSHLRKGSEHKDKFWQSWHLESWSVEQLVALHDDDHTNSVPTFEPEQTLVATVADTDPTPSAFFGAFADALIRTADQSATGSADILYLPTPSIIPTPIPTPIPLSETSEGILYGSWFDVDFNTPDFLPGLIAKLMKDQNWKNDALGLTLNWSGDRSFKLNSTSIIITPPVKATVKRFGITASASVSELRFSDDYKSLTVITPERLIPDLQINFN